jgi:hypothetical protein
LGLRQTRARNEERRAPRSCRPGCAHSPRNAWPSDDRAWVDRFLRQTIHGKLIGGAFPELQQTAYRLAGVLSDVTNSAPPDRLPQSRRQGRKSGAVKDLRFQHFVRNLLVDAKLTGGKLALEKNIKKGALIDAINMLAPHLPVGFVPKPLKMSTLQRIKRRVSEIDLDADEIRI